MQVSYNLYNAHLTLDGGIIITLIFTILRHDQCIETRLLYIGLSACLVRPRLTSDNPFTSLNSMPVSDAIC